MANSDFPYGLTFSHTVHGGPPRLEQSPFCSSSNAIFRGDFVALSTSAAYPMLDPTTYETDGAKIFGVAAQYLAAGSTDKTVLCYTDLQNTVFRIQVDNTTNITSYSSTVNLTWATTRPTTPGSTVTGQAYMELDADTYAALGTYVLSLVDGGLVPTPDNVWDGGNQEVYVQVRIPENRNRFGTSGDT